MRQPRVGDDVDNGASVEMGSLEPTKTHGTMNCTCSDPGVRSEKRVCKHSRSAPPHGNI